jgi:hypothetical protein
MKVARLLAWPRDQFATPFLKIGDTTQGYRIGESRVRSGLVPLLELSV